MLDVHSRSVIDMLDNTYFDLGKIGKGYEHQVKIVYGDIDQVLLAIENILSLIPEHLSLYGNYPNPFNPSTTIRYGLPEPRKVRMTVVNIKGQEIAELINDWRDMGRHEVIWNGKDQLGRSAASGIYFTILSDGETVRSHKVMFIK